MLLLSISQGSIPEILMIKQLTQDIKVLYRFNVMKMHRLNASYPIKRRIEKFIYRINLSI